MKYFKNTELAKLYHVSEKSVRNWIESTKQGKLDFILYETDGKLYIANTTKNIALVEKLVEKGKKFKNSRGLKTITPSKDFYKIYNQKEIVDIISNITIHKEIPLQYGYLDGGAESWDLYANRLIHEQGPNILTRTSELIELQATYIDKITGSNRKVNVVDLGPGNGLPIRPTLERLLHEGRLNRYIAIDISQEMLTILEKNIKEWFDGKIKIECYRRNIAEERFDDLFIEERLDSQEVPLNLAFFLGGTLSNFRLPDHVLRVINSSLGPDDLFFYTSYLDTPYTRRYFDFSGVAYNAKDPQQSGLIPSLLQLTDSLCDFRLVFNEGRRCRFKWMTPKVDLRIQFEIDGKTFDMELRKDEPILLWRHKHFTYTELINFFDQNDFDLLQASKSETQDYTLFISKIKSGIITR